MERSELGLHTVMSANSWRDWQALVLLVSLSCKQYQISVSNCQAKLQASSQVIYNQ
jgi:hypothetical protein